MDWMVVVGVVVALLVVAGAVGFVLARRQRHGQVQDMFDDIAAWQAERDAAVEEGDERAKHVLRVHPTEPWDGVDMALKSLGFATDDAAMKAGSGREPLAAGWTRGALTIQWDGKARKLAFRGEGAGAAVEEVARHVKGASA